jgi:leucine dehydrogenase
MATVELETGVSEEYEDVRVIEGPRSGLTMAVAVHRLVGGRSLGGCRMWAYASAADAVADVERLARSMTFKAAAAELGLGGGKGVIALPAGASGWVGTGKSRRRDALHDFAELVESFGGRYVTAQDVGVSLEDMTYVSRFTDHVAGHPVEDGGAGDPSPYTAHGVEIAIRASLGGTSLYGKRIVVIGLGHVGGELARRLARAGARLAVTDVNPQRRQLADEIGAEWVGDDALFLDADVVAPCALGGVLNEDTVPRLNAPVVAGAANNQLAHDGIAELMHRTGVLWAPDFVANAGGLIAVSDELYGFDAARVERRIATIGDTLAEVYARTTTSTLTAAKELAAERLGGDDA